MTSRTSSSSWTDPMTVKITWVKIRHDRSRWGSIQRVVLAQPPQLEPPPSSDLPYARDAPRLPQSLDEALLALQEDPVLCAGIGPEFIECFLRIKAAEIARYHQEVSEWEHREYFDLF